MKNKIWFLVMMAGIIIGVIACDDPKAQPVYCPDTDNNGNGHLGIGENCSKNIGDCTGLYDYAKGTAFPKSIYRVGAKGNNEATFTSTAGAMATAYNGLIGTMAEGRFNASGLTVVHMYIDGKDYTWSGSGILGIKAGATFKNWMITDLGSSQGLDIAQLQPALNRVIFMAGNKNAKQVIAGGADKAPKVNTVAQNFRSNRQVIARNNRNVKTLLRQA